MGGEDLAFSFSSYLMKSLILDLKTLIYTSRNSLLFIFFASFLVEVFLLRGMNSLILEKLLHGHWELHSFFI